MIHDITIPMNSTLAVWPGDTEFAYTTTAWGDICVGAVTMSCHTGTHAGNPLINHPGAGSPARSTDLAAAV